MDVLRGVPETKSKGSSSHVRPRFSSKDSRGAKVVSSHMKTDKIGCESSSAVQPYVRALLSPASPETRPRNIPPTRRPASMTARRRNPDIHGTVVSCSTVSANVCFFGTDVF